jgi:F-box/leucine-rich repeat protein 2/20
MTPTSPSINGIPFDQPHAKLKGRHRLMQGLQRISSSPSLAKIGRTRSSDRVYVQSQKASISCISLGSPASSYPLSPPNSFTSQLSNGYSTAPTTPGSPGSINQSYFDAQHARVRAYNSSSDSLAERIQLPSDLAKYPTHSGLRALSVVAEQPLLRRPSFNFWQDLPHEIRVQIFSFLTPREIIRMSSVSKQWHDMCFDGQLWTSLDTQAYYQSITSEALIKIMLRAGAFVKNLNLRGCVQLRDQWLSIGTRMTNQECRNLENFSIEGCKMERSSIHFFLIRNPNLRQISMPSIQNINNMTMKTIATYCPQLEVLNIDWCSAIDTKGLMKVVQSCPRLTDIRASQIGELDNREFMLELFQRNNLERLILQHCDSLDDEALRIMVEGLDPERDILNDRAIVPPRRLRHLDISRCRGLTDAGIMALAHNVPYLEGLRLCQNNVLTDDALADLLPSLERLTHLEMEEVELLTNATLITLAKSPSAKTLEHLSISYCELMGDIGVLPVLKSCPKLQSLCLDNTRISDLVLMEASEQVRKRGNIQNKRKPRRGIELIAFDCANVTWAGVREVMQGNTRVVQGRRKSTVQAPIQNRTATCFNTDGEPVERETPKRTIEVHTSVPLFPAQIIHLKVFYGWQQTVEEHYKRCVRSEWHAASRLEGKWAEWMVASEEAGVGQGGIWGRNGRRRRRLREAERRVLDDEGGRLQPGEAEEEQSANTSGESSAFESGRDAVGRRGGSGRPRARSGGCVVM